MNIPETITIFFGVSILMAMLIIGVAQAHKAGYKQGQADAIKGIKKYFLIEREDGSRDWFSQREINNFDKSLEYKIIELPETGE